MGPTILSFFIYELPLIQLILIKVPALSRRTAPLQSLGGSNEMPSLKMDVLTEVFFFFNPSLFAFSRIAL